MAIHVSDRTLSRLEYEDLFRELYREMRKKMERVPKRRWNTSARPMMEAMNAAYDAVTRIEEDPIRGTKRAADTRYRMITNAQKRIKEVERPLWTWWNICGDIDEPDMKEQGWEKRARLCDRFNRILGLLRDMQTASSRYDPTTDRGGIIMRYYTEAEIEKATFLRRLRELHRMTHGKHIRRSRIARDAESGLLTELIDTAWYYAVNGNRLRTDSPDENEIRRKCFHTALSALRRAERQLFDLFDNEPLSNREMDEWMGLMNESIRLLAAVAKAGER